MVAQAPTAEQLRAKVKRVRKNHEPERFIAIPSPGEWAGGPTISVDGDEVPVVSCPSVLALR